jgi:hypothetical protein
MDKISDSKTQKTAYHRFRVIASPVSDGQDIKDETEISIRLYDRFVSRFIDHAIPDCQISIDYVALGQKGLIGEIAKEFVDDARAKIEQEKTERPDEENEDGEERENEVDGNDEEINDAGDNNESDKEGNSQNKTIEDGKVDILISVRQLKRMFDDECHDDEDFEMSDDGYFIKYRGEGGDVVIPQGVFLIGNSAFEGCSGLKSVKIPNTVKIICKDAFKDCVNLEEVEMPLDMLKLLMSNIDFCFSGTPIAEMLKKKDLVLQKYKVTIKAEKIEEAEDKEEGNESEKNDMNGDKEESGKVEDDNGGGASNEPA